MVGVGAILFQQLPVSSLFKHFAAFNDRNGVGVNDRGEPMCDHDHGPVMANALQGSLDGGLCFVVHGAGGFIEYQNGRVLQQCPRQREALPLSSRQTNTAFTYRCIQTLRQGFDEGPGFRGFCGIDDVGIGGSRIPVSQVFPDRSLE